MPNLKKKSVILNLELGKVVKNGYKVVRCPKFLSRRTSSGDVTYHFKVSGTAVNITIDFMILLAAILKRLRI